MFLADHLSFNLKNLVVQCCETRRVINSTMILARWLRNKGGIKGVLITRQQPAGREARSLVLFSLS